MGQPVPFAFDTLLSETYSGVDDRLREVVRDEARWTQLWTHIHRRVSPPPPRPPVDFSRHMLIAVATGTRRRGGFDITVRQVAVRGSRLEVDVLETCPSEAMVSTALTQPVQIVRLERLPLSPGFRDVKSSSCD